MAPHPEPSFTPRRKWTIALNAALLILVVASVVVMVEYLSRIISTVPSQQPDYEPSLVRTVHFLGSLDQPGEGHESITTKKTLLHHRAGSAQRILLRQPKISVRTVDYTRDAGRPSSSSPKHRSLASPNF